MTPIIIVPGWRDSGPGHWQSLWADTLPGAVRVQQDDWITPSRKAWIASIGKTILEQTGPVVVVAHSLGCIATTHLPPEATARIQGALQGLMRGPGEPSLRACKTRGTSTWKPDLATGHWVWRCCSRYVINS